MKKGLGLFSIALLTAVSANGLLAQSNTSASGEFSLQGRLTSMTGGPVADGQHSVTLNIYARGSGSGSGQAMYTETDQVTTVNGIFSTMVGDNGNNGSKLMVDGSSDYEIGIAVDNSTELAPRLRIGDAVSAIRADMAANANAVGGFMIDSTGTRANSIVTTDANGRLRGSLLGNSSVTSINGLTGNINLQVTGTGISTDTTGGVLRLNFTGSGSGNGGGNLSFPFTNSSNLSSGDVFSLNNSGSGSVGVFANNGSGSALRATSNLSTSTSGTIEATNNGTGSAISAMSNSTANAALRIQNRASGANSRAISSVNATGTATFEVMANGQTMINSTVGNALDVTTSAAGEAALSVNGGLRLNGPVGTGTLDLSNGSTVINNAHVKANSIVMITMTSATNGATIVPIRVSSQGNGSFTVSAVQGVLGSLTGSLSFNYLVINQ
jgi:hypothetical protein